METWIELDHRIFRLINLEWANPLFDHVLPAVTDLHKTQSFMFLVFAALALWIWRKKGGALKWILILILSVGLTDLFAYRAIKKPIARPRPQFTGVELTLRTNQHSGDSFPSNHAANMFAAATALSGAAPYLAPFFFTVAFIIAYSRVYVGVHFPSDVLVGALLGIIIAALVRRLFRRWLGSGSVNGSKFSHT